MTIINSVKAFISERASWHLLLAVLFLPVLLNDNKGVINIYRVLICIPVLLCIRWTDFQDFLKNRFFYLFSATTLWFTLSLIWSESNSIHNMAGKILASFALLLLTYNCSKYHPDKIKNIKNYFIASCIILVFSILLNAGKLDNTLDGDIFGVFSNRNPVSWILAAGSVLAFHSMLFEKKFKLLHGVSFIFLFCVIFNIASRGSLLGVVAGCIFAVIYKGYHYKNKIQRRKLYKLIVSAILLLLISSAIGYTIFFEEIYSLISRSDSFRFEIYSNAYKAITSSVQSLFFGHGIASSARNTLSNGVLINNWHSVYINALFYTGLIGLFLFAACIANRFIDAFLHKKEINCWDSAVISSIVIFAFDGHRFFDYPGGILLAFTLPLFFANALDFQTNYNSKEYAKKKELSISLKARAGSEESII